MMIDRPLKRVHALSSDPTPFNTSYLVVVAFCHSTLFNLTTISIIAVVLSKHYLLHFIHLVAMFVCFSYSKNIEALDAVVNALVNVFCKANCSHPLSADFVKMPSYIEISVTPSYGFLR